MTIRVDGFNLEIPSFIVQSLRGLSKAETDALWQELYEDIEDMKAFKQAEEYNRAHPGKCLSQDEIEREFGLA